MANALTNPGGSLAAFPPNTMPAANTTHATAKEQSNASGGNYARGADKDANDIQPGLKAGQDFQRRPDTGTVVTATAGAPGTWSAGTKPNDAADATRDGVKASPTTKWTIGQYVQGNDAGAAGEMYWDNSKWVKGKAPA